MPTLVVHLKIPFECDPPTRQVPSLTFSHWLPIGTEHAIRASQDEMTLALWFDEKCTWWASQPTAEELKNHVNVLAHYVNADITVNNVPKDLSLYMQGRDFTRLATETENGLQSAYDLLGRQIGAFTLSRVNRLIGYARARKGQYWITELEFDPRRIHSLFNHFEARGSIDEGPTFRFQPATSEHITITTDSESKYIVESEWPAFQAFVEGIGNPALVGELLAGAEHLWRIGHRRGALTEAVTALEVALYGFGRNPRTNLAFGQLLATRLATSSIAAQIKHLGLSASVGYLLPMILPETILPSDVLRGCQTAITLRQNVVHNGQRDVDEHATRSAVSSIRRCCEILESISADDESS
jgi:hypothetical protein